MAAVNTYLNFPGNAEDAFNFYKSVFGTDFSGQGIFRYKDVDYYGSCTDKYGVHWMFNCAEKAK